MNCSLGPHSFDVPCKYSFIVETGNVVSILSKKLIEAAERITLKKGKEFVIFQRNQDDDFNILFISDNFRVKFDLHGFEEIEELFEHCDKVEYEIIDKNKVPHNINPKIIKTKDYSKMVTDLHLLGIIEINDFDHLLSVDPRAFKLNEWDYFISVDCLGTSLFNSETEKIENLWKANFYPIEKDLKEEINIPNVQEEQTRTSERCYG